MEKENKTNRFLKGDLAIPIIAIASICIIFLIYGSVVWNGFDDPVASGQFGDTFGALTAFFTGITLAGLVYTTYLQRKDLLTQIDMLKEQIDENRESRKALEDQAKHLYDASRISAIASKIDFFSLSLNESNREITSNELYRANATNVSQHLIHELDELLGVAGTINNTYRLRTDCVLEIRNCSIEKPITMNVIHGGNRAPFVCFIAHETQANVITQGNPFNLPAHDPVTTTHITHVGQAVSITPTSDNIFIELTGIQDNWENIQLKVYCSKFNPSDIDSLPTEVTN